MTKLVRIGNAQAFWGDRDDAAAELLTREPELDYLTMDYLAEVSMSILARQRERDPDAGFAREFVDVTKSLVPYWSAGGRCRLIANAGGLNPRGCAKACQDALEAAGCRSLRIAVVSGDDVLVRLKASAASDSPEDFSNLETGEPIRSIGDRLVTANAYLGAEPIVEAFELQADIVITGRVADPSLVVAACRHHFGWSANDFTRLAGATVAGHLIECGTQVTGGISTDWLDIADPADIPFPIIEVSDDGSCVVTKSQNTGGRVSEMTVKEQLVYEIGDPSRYLSPDATVSFLSLQVDDRGDDRVQVGGASGTPPPETLKVSATYRDGYRAAGTLTIVGRAAQEKARRCGLIVLERVRQAGFDLRDSLVECIGGDESEVVLRIAVESSSRDAVERFTRELMPLITSGPQGVTGYSEGRPRIHPVLRYWPTLVDRTDVAPQVESFVTRPRRTATSPTTRSKDSPSQVSWASVRETGSSRSPATDHLTTLFDIACARSGDKGTSANVGVIARHPRAWEFLRTWLTEARVAKYFEALELDDVERFELPNLGALNFVLHGALRRGLRNDAQGKALGQMLLQMPLPDDVRTISLDDDSQD